MTSNENASLQDGLSEHVISLVNKSETAPRLNDQLVEALRTVDQRGRTIKRMQDEIDTRVLMYKNCTERMDCIIKQNRVLTQRNELISEIAALKKKTRILLNNRLVGDYGDHFE